MKKIMFGNSLMLLGIAIMAIGYCYNDTCRIKGDICRNTVGVVSFNYRGFCYGYDWFFR